MYWDSNYFVRQAIGCGIIILIIGIIIGGVLIWILK